MAVEIFTRNNASGGTSIRFFDPSNDTVLDFSDWTWKLLASATTPYIAMSEPAAVNLGAGRKLFTLAFELLKLHRGPLPKRFEVGIYDGATPASGDNPLTTQSLTVQAGGRDDAPTRIETYMGCRTTAGYAVQLMARLMRNGRPLSLMNFGKALYTADAGTDVITSNAHGLSDGDWVCFPDHSGTLPAGLTAETAYEVRDSTTNTFKVSATAGGAAVDLTTNGTGPLWWDKPTATFTVRQHMSGIVAFTKALTAADIFNNRFEAEYPDGAAFTVNTGTDVITSNAHGLSDGSEIYMLTGPSGTLPGGLDDGLKKFVINSTTNTFQASNILAGSAIDITSAGTGVFRWIPATAVLESDRLYEVAVALTVGGETIEDSDTQLVFG